MAGRYQRQDESTIYIASRERILYELLSDYLKNRGCEIAGDFFPALPLDKVVERWSPDIVLMCLDDSSHPGIEKARSLFEPKNATQFIALIISNKRPRLSYLLNNGWKGVACLQDSKNDLLKCLQTVNSGEPYVSSQIKRRVTTELNVGLATRHKHD